MVPNNGINSLAPGPNHLANLGLNLDLYCTFYGAVVDPELMLTSVKIPKISVGDGVRAMGRTHLGLTFGDTHNRRHVIDQKTIDQKLIGN
jgi:hypothetical protein